MQTWRDTRIKINKLYLLSRHFYCINKIFFNRLINIKKTQHKQINIIVTSP